MSKHDCKCKKAPECEECPEWIFTFADLVMLMMGFFVILWVLKPPAGKNGASDAQESEQQKQWINTVGEIRKGFGYVPDPTSADPVDRRMLQKQGPRQGAEIELPRETATGTDHAVTSVRPGTVSSVGSRLLFDVGAARLTPETLRALDEIADKIRGHYNIVMVKGHASLDDLPEATSAAQRMDLSLRRAQAAADYLISKGVSPEILRVQGCSTYEPVRQRVYNANLQAENRRVEVEVTAELVTDRQDRGAAAEKASASPTTAPAD